MTEALQLLTVLAVGATLASWGMWRGRKERESENKRDERQTDLDLKWDQNDKLNNNRVAMSRTQI